MTVSNTTFWSILVLIWLCVILRPVIMYPFSVAISFGPKIFVGSYDMAQLQFNILIIFVINMLTAMVVCFISLCLYLIKSPLMEIRRMTAIALAGCAHLISTIFGYVLLNFLYKKPDDLKEAIVKASKRLF